MLGAAKGRLGAACPQTGPRAVGVLVELVNDALAMMDARPAGTSGALGAVSGGVARQSAAETTTAPRKQARRRGRASRNLQMAPDQQPPDPAGDDDDPQALLDGDSEVDEEHVETWRLVRLAQHGDGDAFGRLYDRYVDSVFRFIYYRVNDRALAEDFTSETFLRALRRISTISYQGRDIGAWFITIARNIVLDHVKSARNRLETTTGETPESKEHVPSTENAVLQSLQSEHLMAAIGELGNEQRECVLLRFIHGLSVNETAAVMGKNGGAIKALQHRAVRKLADLVGAELR